MPIYNYIARDKTGKQVKGTVEAALEKEAAELVRERGLFLTGLTVIRQSVFGISLKGLHHAGFEDIVEFTSQMATMINSGLQLQDALQLLKAQTTNPAMTDIITKISREIQSGGNLATALSHFPKVFASTYLALIKAGESSGTLDQVMTQLAENLEKDQEFRAKVKSALIYPAIILIAMVVVFFLLMTLVVPKLTELYVDFGADLPLPTRILSAVSDFTVRFWWLIILMVTGGFWGFQKWKETGWGRNMWDAFTLRLPIIGKLQKQVMLVEFTRTLGMLVGAGVHILDSLNILVYSLDNIHYQNAVKEITKRVEKGFALGALFAQYPLFPPILAQMVKVGEETGKMDESLTKLATYFERESNYTIKGLTTAIEPIIMVILGVGVGFIVFAIITPIYNLTSQFR